MKITVIVVVLTPPEVEPGEPPINIKNIIRSLPPEEREDAGIVTNPALRLVTDVKSAVRILSPMGISR